MRAGPVNIPASDRLWLPRKPVSEMFGNSNARAAPIWALAAIRLSSAWRMSGRRSNSEAGRPAGSSGTIAICSKGLPRGTSPGAFPSSRFNASSVCSMDRCTLAICAVAVIEELLGLLRPPGRWRRRDASGAGSGADCRCAMPPRLLADFEFQVQLAQRQVRRHDDRRSAKR